MHTEELYDEKPASGLADAFTEAAAAACQQTVMRVPSPATASSELRAPEDAAAQTAKLKSVGTR